MTDEQLNQFTSRIKNVQSDLKPSFGKMNAHQMIVHCADQIRVALNYKKVNRETADPRDIMRMVKAGETVPTPKGLDQVKGEGTPTTTLDNDKVLLVELVEEFYHSSTDMSYGDHPYFGPQDKHGWSRMVVYHLEHHLSQFGA